MPKIIIANWKANPQTLEEAQELFGAEIIEAAKYKNVKTVICPPFMFLKDLASIPNNVLGAQDVFWEESEIFEPQKLGISFVLIGHSDRRYKIGESDVVINKKLKAALLADITPILLVGEREKGDNRERVLSEQLTADLDGLTKDEVSKVLIAYEPVWAISTNPNAEPDIPENTLGAIKILQEFLYANFQFPILRHTQDKFSNFQFLYGGSINDKNVGNFLEHPEISGAVIGGASLRKNEFAEILRIISKI